MARLSRARGAHCEQLRGELLPRLGAILPHNLHSTAAQQCRSVTQRTRLRASG